MANTSILDNFQYPQRPSLPDADLGHWTFGFFNDGLYIRFENGPTLKVSTQDALDNLNATTDPTTANNASEGYSVGSKWFNQSTQEVWILAALDSPGPGDAFWVSTTLGTDDLGVLATKNNIAGADIQDGVVTLAKLADLPPNTIIANNTSVSTTPLALSVADFLAMVGVQAGATARPTYRHTISAQTSGTIPASVHLCGSNITSLQFFRDNGGTFVSSRINLWWDASSGDIFFEAVAAVTGIVQVVG